MRTQSKQYKGFILTPHTSQLDSGPQQWSVAVFVRTDSEPADKNRYFRLEGVFASSRSEALKHALSYGKRLVDLELLPAIKRPAEKRIEVYRRPNGGLTWHFSRRCTFWPEQEFEERRTRPMRSELCNECLTHASIGYY